MIIIIRLKIVLFFLFINCCCWAQFDKFTDQLFFKQFNTDKGLSQASVNCILNDAKGFVWFGTDDGLSRFDGSEFKIFRNQLGDSTTINGNTIQTLLDDGQGNIWIGTSEGLCRFNQQHEKFKTFAVQGLEYYGCTDLKMDKNNRRIWMGLTQHGIYYIDLQTEEIHQLNNEKLNDTDVFRIEPIQNKLYVGTTGNGLLSVDLISGKVEEIPLAKTGESFNFPIRSLKADKDILWIGTDGGGLKKLNTTTKKVDSFVSKQNQLSDDKVWSLGLMKDGRLWVGTDGGGLTLLNPLTGKSIFYKHSDYDNRSISSNTIRSILVDALDDSWFGTFNGGVSYHAGFGTNFLSFKRDPENPLSLSHNSVLSFCEVDDGALIGTDGGGLDYLKNGNFYRYKFPGNLDKPNVITCIRKSAKGEILIGTYQHGLYLINPNGKILQYKTTSDSTSINCNIIWEIAEDANGSFWLATELGINRFNPQEGTFTHNKNMKSGDNKAVFTDAFAQSIMIDSDGTLWGGQYGNLLSYNIKTDKVKNFASAGKSINGLPNKQILSIQEDCVNKGIIWFSVYGDGIVKFNSHTKRFTNITEEEGLPSNLVFAVQPDKQGYVWLTTNKGLVQYDPVRKSFYILDENYGVDVAPFKDNARLLTSKGYLLFGGTNGFLAFLPAKISYPEKRLHIMFTGFQFFNEEVPIDNIILKRSITETNHIELPYDKAKFITFKFSALQFMAPSSIYYEYMLEGFENKWRSVEDRRVSFSNLFPGNYKLRIRSGYAPGNWGDESVMAITVVPAWWMTVYAWVGAALFFFGSVYGIFRYRTYQLNERKSELERIVAEQNREIREKNMELETQNEELSQHNEELLTHRETISLQNKLLSEAQDHLKEINQSLESLVQQRTSKLNKTIFRLNKTIKELDAFLYSASHDLVAPLKSILGLVNLAKMETIDSDKDMYFEHIELSVRKLEGMIHTLMQHSYNTKAIARHQPTDIYMLATESISELQFMPESGKIKFNIDLKDAMVVTDIPRLKIIITNLISNAIKYSDPRKESNLIDIKFSKYNESWTLAIKDNGIGIDGERLGKVFDLFYRATESAKGSGLGLYIVKETVERMGGEITVESEFGLWTKFTLTFPCERTEAY